MNWTIANQTYLSLAMERIKALLVERIAENGQALDSRLTSTVPPVTEIERSLQTLSQSLTAAAPLTHLCDLFQLSAFERDVLLLCVGMELDAAFAPLFAVIHGDDQRTYPTLSLALGTLPDPNWSVLGAQAPLRQWQLIEIGSGRSLTASPLRIDERILTWLTDGEQWDGQLMAWAKPIPLGQVNAHRLVNSHQSLAQRLTNIWVQAQQRHRLLPILQLCGGEESDRRTIAAAACQRLGLNLYGLAIATLPHNYPDLYQLARRWRREALLSNNALLLEWDDYGPDPLAITALVRQFIAEIPTPLLLSAKTRRPLGQQSLGQRKVVTVDVALPTTQEQIQLWGTTLDISPEQLNGQVQRLVGQFNLNAGMIQSVYLSALGQLDPLPEPAKGGMSDPQQLESLLWRACRIQARQRMDNYAQPIESAATWEDLILPPTQKAILADIAAHLRQRLKVYQDWGFAAKSQRGLGITALFSGISGTGKTLAAEVLAQELKLDLYKIDLSTIISKYIGETEKNLSKVFDAAETGGAILLFDEADALFGKRNEVKDSHDRYANIEVSYLLQRMESYRGLAILTTNLPDAIDRAFLRRIRFIVQFPFPDAAQREHIWQRMFPPQTPTADLSFKKLARLNVAGGNIRNIALNAAFLAADADESIGMAHLLDATRREYHKLELPLTDAEIKGWL